MAFLSKKQRKEEKMAERKTKKVKKRAKKSFSVLQLVVERFLQIPTEAVSSQLLVLIGGVASSELANFVASSSEFLDAIFFADRWCHDSSEGFLAQPGSTMKWCENPIDIIRELRFQIDATEKGAVRTLVNEFKRIARIRTEWNVDPPTSKSIHQWERTLRRRKL
ncbi:hypothetical protein TNCV_1446821 [Trichonephila clavipes]|nr:hypothetical protein TNCV_1446821 [Trichonephila clavipes]